MVQVGFGVRDISPKPGMQMPGGFFKRVGKGVRDPLLAVACVLFDGDKALAVVGIDTLFVTKDTVAAARRGIRQSTRIPEEHVLIGASHTHSGGPVADCLGCDADPVYLEMLVQGIVGAVTEAWQSLHDAEIGVGTGREESILFNRRFLMRDGREITHPGKPGTPHHGDIVHPAGPTDPDLGVLAARDRSGQLMGVVVCYACHSTVVGGDLFSPDYAGYLRKHLQARYGMKLPVCFLLGPCGDVTQVDNMSIAREFGPEHADMMGSKLAAETVRTIGRMDWMRAVPLAVHSEEIPVPIRPDPDVDRERPPYGLGSGANIEPVYARERELVARMRQQTPSVSCEVQALRIGPLGVVSNGAEYFCEYGLRIKKCSPFARTWVVTLANEWVGYVPTAQAFVAGGYEPRTARSSKLVPQAGQLILETSLRALRRVAPEQKNR